MGKISILTKKQKVILDGIKKDDFIFSNFYFTGGTALSEYYLHHRLSEDLDFFTERDFDHKLIFSLITNLSNRYGFHFRSEAVASVYMFYIQFPNTPAIKVDFNFYDYQRLDKSIEKDGLHIDSLLDIATNKLLTITQRNDVKDFVDFYYLEPKFGIWDLIEGVKIKFKMELELDLLASDLLKIDDFTILPKMIKPLSLEKLRKFFREKAVEIGKRAVE